MIDRRARMRRHLVIVEELAGDVREAERVEAAVSELLAEMGHAEANVVRITLRSKPLDPQANEAESDKAFLERLHRLGEDWRFSDEFIGLIVRRRFPRSYGDLQSRP